MGPASIYWLPSEIREELDLPVASKIPLHNNPSIQNTRDSMATYFDPTSEYFHKIPLTDRSLEPQAISEDFEAVHYKLHALTQANLEAYQVHLQSQAAYQPYFQEFATRCPPAGQKLYLDEESRYSQWDGGVNGPTGFHWEICSSKLTGSDFDEERPVTAHETQGMMQWGITESVLTISEPEIQRKRALDDVYESAHKRFCHANRFGIPVEASVLDDVAGMLSLGWELPSDQPTRLAESDVSTFYLPTCQTYWDNWQPEPGYERYHYADVKFEGYTMQMQPELFEVQEPQQAEPYYEEPQYLALTPMVEDTPQYVEEASSFMLPTPLTPMISDAPYYVESPLPMTPMFSAHPDSPLSTTQLPNEPYASVTPSWTKPVNGRPIPPWRRHKAFADTEEGEMLRTALPLPATRFLGMKALDLLHEFEEHPIPDIANILPLKQKIRPAQEDILNWRFFSQRLPLAQQRNKQVQHLKLFWNSKATHDVHPHFYNTQAVGAC